MSTASNTPNPVIMVPGITATDMQDDYPLPPEQVWTTRRRREHDRLALYPPRPPSSPDPLYEVREPALVRPGGPFPLVYGEMVEELREELDPAGKVHTPVYPFSYDWRQPLDVTARTLQKFILEVIQRTKLTPVYRKSKWVSDPKVNLVGHSMGGLVIAGALTLPSEDAKEIATCVDKIATIGTPWRGSCDAITKLVAGSGTLGNRSQASRERRMARLTPSLYYLLPNYENAVRGISDIFDGDGWQESVPRTIGEAIALVEGDEDKSVMLAKGKENLRQYLEDARKYRKRIDTWEIDKDKFLVIAGIGEYTLTSVCVIKKGNDDNDSRFAFLGKDERIGDGDGTVPSKSSIPPFVDQIRPPIVCVSPEDFGIHEVRDRGLVMLTGFHEFMPRMNLVIRLLVRFFGDQQYIHNNTWGRRHPEAEDWNLPFPLEQRRRKWKLPYARP